MDGLETVPSIYRLPERKEEKTLVVHVPVPSIKEASVEQIKSIVAKHGALVREAVEGSYRNVLALPNYGAKRTEFEVL